MSIKNLFYDNNFDLKCKSINADLLITDDIIADEGVQTGDLVASRIFTYNDQNVRDGPRHQVFGLNGLLVPITAFKGIIPNSDSLDMGNISDPWRTIYCNSINFDEDDIDPPGPNLTYNLSTYVRQLVNITSLATSACEIPGTFEFERIGETVKIDITFETEGTGTEVINNAPLVFADIPIKFRPLGSNCSCSYYIEITNVRTAAQMVIGTDGTITFYSNVGTGSFVPTVDPLTLIKLGYNYRASFVYSMNSLYN